MEAAAWVRPWRPLGIPRGVRCTGVLRQGLGLLREKLMPLFRAGRRSSEVGMKESETTVPSWSMGGRN